MQNKILITAQDDTEREFLEMLSGATPEAMEKFIHIMQAEAQRQKGGTLMKSADRLNVIKFHADRLRDTTQSHVNEAACALSTIGEMLFIHAIEDKEKGRIREVEAEGLALAVQSIARYLQYKAEEMEESGDFMVERIEEMETRQ